MQETNLQQRLSGNGTVVRKPGGWRLSIPPGDDRTYRLAQLDDYGDRARGDFPWREGGTLRLRARASAQNGPGTWGFGFWNDPLGMALNPAGLSIKLPALPQAAWFFAASPSNHLSLGDAGPANGYFAQVYRSPQIGMWLLRAALKLPFRRADARRQLASRIREAAVGIHVDAREWHTYEVDWSDVAAAFLVDGQAVFRARIGPRAPLGCVVWIDNQFARFDPQGRLGRGLEACPTEAWLEIADLKTSSRVSPPP